MSAKAALAVADILNELSRRGLGPTMAALGVEALGEIETTLEQIVDRHLAPTEEGAAQP